MTDITYKPISKRIVITNKLGLHARAAIKFVETASRFRSYVRVTRDAYTVDGKSIMDMMTLGATYQTPITITVQGNDAETALQQLLELVEQGFGE